MQPYVLSSSDDMTIKLWDWSKNWQNTMVFEGHTHYVMQIAINPKDTNTFASASLDRTVKVWGFNSPTAHFTLEGHEKGVNAVDYALAGDKPYIVSGADDKMVKVWDYQNKTCVQTLDGHRHNVSMVSFHPEIPYSEALRRGALQQRLLDAIEAKMAGQDVATADLAWTDALVAASGL